MEKYALRSALGGREERGGKDARSVAIHQQLSDAKNFGTMPYPASLPKKREHP